MIKADMHVHSVHSKNPSEWFLQKIGARESYTPIETVYLRCKERGMTFVTITDHNTIDGALELRAAHPEDTFISVEATAYFPEDGCKVHILCYDITPEQFSIIQKLRTNIYELRDYLRDERIACSVAHATYSVNGRLTKDTLEKLILLFDVFEGINGARNRSFNQLWLQTLQSLTPNNMEQLYIKHGIEPWGSDSWIKGFTGGSDDHAGLMMGETFTMSDDIGIKGLLERVRQRETLAGGRHGNHKNLAFAIYKIAYEYSKEKTGSTGDDGILNLVNQMLFEERRIGLKNWVAIKKMKRAKDSRDRIISEFFESLSTAQAEGLRPDEQINHVYNSLSKLADGFFSMISTSLEKDLHNGDTGRLIKNISASIPAVFLAAPFFTTMRHLHHDRQLVVELREGLGMCERRKQKKILWFSDTVIELNGVAVTMGELARTAAAGRRPMKLVTSLPLDAGIEALPENTVNLPCIYSFTPDFYNAYTLRVPSLLRSMDLIAEENPDEIVISTPGPVGLIGLAAARLMDIKCTGIYHTDFTAQVDMFIGDEWVSSMVESYTRLFFKMMDEVRVPTQQYMDMLEMRGIERKRMKLFRRGIDPAFVVDQPARQAEYREKFILGDAPVMLWAGRLGQEKNLDMLMQIYRGVIGKCPECKLLIVGEGPERERLQEEMSGCPGVVFAGRVSRDDLPHIYPLAEVFVFPSTTDTFGMVVLEAQACGVPALVTNVGGPQEIVIHGHTGYVLPVDRPEQWTAQILEIIDQRRQDSVAAQAARQKIKTVFQTNYGWDRVLDEMMGPAERHECKDWAEVARQRPQAVLQA